MFTWECPEEHADAASQTLRGRTNNMAFYEMASDMAMKIAEAEDRAIRKQLSWMIQRGLLEIHKKEGKFLRLNDTQELVYEQEIELKLRDAEYIEKLEAELQGLRQFKQQVRALTNKD